VDECEGGNVFTIGPAAREVLSAVDTIVERASEVKVVSGERLDDRAIFIDIRLVGLLRDRDRIDGRG
jgi:hypothetical protein